MLPIKYGKECGYEVEVSFLVTELNPGVPVSCWFMFHAHRDSAEVFQSSETLCFKLICDHVSGP